MDDEDVELQELDSGSSGGVQSVRKNISLKLKGKTKPKTKSKSTKSKKLSKKEDSDPLTPVESYKDFQNDYDIDADISKLKPPTFTTLERGPSEPLHKNTPLRWDYKVNLIGEKVVNPMIHCCEKCTLPILIYGRMIPCKHIFCTACARRAEKVCPRCKEKVIRVETTGLGTVFLCTYGGSRHGNAGCRRTYLSQRDLQAHVSHRHLRMANVPDAQAAKQGAVSQKGEYENREGHPQYLSSSGAVHVGHDMSAAPASHDPRLAYHRDDVAAMAHMIPQQTHIQYTTVPTPAVSPAVVAPGTQQTHAYPGTGTPRTNLITIPIQEDHSGEFRQGQQVTYHHQPTQSGTITYAHAPPPLQHAFNHPPPGHLHQTPIVSYSTAGTQISYSQPLTTQTFTQPPPAHFTHSVPPLQSVVPPAMYSTPPPTAVHQTPNLPPPPAIVQYAPPARYPATSQQPQYDERMPPGTYLPAPPGTGIPSWSGVARASIIPQGSTPVSSVVTQPLQRPHYYS